MKTHYRYILLGAWMLLIFGLSSEPANMSSARSGAIVEAIQALDPGVSEDVLTFVTRKAAHIFLYLVLGVLAFGAISGHGYRLRAARVVLLSILVCGAYAVTDELHQQYVPGRSAELRDVLIDTAAASAGAGGYGYYVVRRHQRRPQGHKHVG